MDKEPNYKGAQVLERRYYDRLQQTGMDDMVKDEIWVAEYRKHTKGRWVWWGRRPWQKSPTYFIEDALETIINGTHTDGTTCINAAEFLGEIEF